MYHGLSEKGGATRNNFPRVPDPRLMRIAGAYEDRRNGLLMLLIYELITPLNQLIPLDGVFMTRIAIAIIPREN